MRSNPAITSSQRTTQTSEWTPVRLKFFDFKAGYGFLTPCDDPKLGEIFVHTQEFKEAGIMWIPSNKIIWARYIQDAKGRRATKLSFLKPPGVGREQPNKAP